jgi:hypothetical protein
MGEFWIQMIASMMWQTTVSRLSQTLRMVMGSIMEGEMVLVVALWEQVALTSSRFVFGFLHFLYFDLSYINSFVGLVPVKTTSSRSSFSDFLLQVYLPVTQ